MTQKWANAKNKEHEEKIRTHREIVVDLIRSLPNAS